jgi:glutamyl endopeptidase
MKRPYRALFTTALSITCLGLMSFGGVGVAASSAADPAVTIQGLPIGTDNRTQVTNTTAFPSSSIVQILQYGSGACTGTLISPNVVLTAGHCVKYQGTTTPASALSVIPGRNGSSQPFGSCTVTQTYMDPTWVASESHANDWALLRLGCNIGQSAGWPVVKAGDFTGQTATVRGYPGNKPAGTMWTHSGTVLTTTTNNLVYDIDTSGGQSGSPVLAADNGIIGVHTAYMPGSNHNEATRLTSARVATINSYVSAWACTAVVRAYTDTNRGGTGYSYCPGAHIPTGGPGHPGIANDTMSSLEILDANYEVTLWADGNATSGLGAKLGPMPKPTAALQYNLPDYGFNDMVSAMAVTPKSSNILLYKDVNPGQAAVAMSIPAGTVNNPSLVASGLNDVISAVVVPTGRTITLYEDVNYPDAKKLVLKAGFYNLPGHWINSTTNWNDRVSSFKAT